MSLELSLNSTGDTVDWVHVCGIETGSDCLTVALSVGKLVAGGDVVVLLLMWGGEGEESTVGGGDVTIDHPVLEVGEDSSLPLFASMVPAEAVLLGVLEEVGGVAGEEWSIIG